jgi:hypothetical protein
VACAEYYKRRGATRVLTIGQLVEAAGQIGKPKRKRGPNRPTLASALKQAANAGLKPSGATISADGKIELRFGKVDTEDGTVIETPEQLRRLI